MSVAPLKVDVRPGDALLGQGDLAAQTEAGGARAGAGGSGLAGQRPPAPEAAVQQRFEALLTGTVEPSASRPALASTGPLVGFPGLVQGAGIGQPAARVASTPSDQVQAFADHVSRVMVSSDGGGSRQVRLDLDEAALPGVTVTVQEQEGRWQVSFVCRQEPARLQLSAQAPWMAATLAERLRRDTLVQVRTDDDEDPCLVEALGFEAGQAR